MFQYTVGGPAEESKDGEAPAAAEDPEAVSNADEPSKQPDGLRKSPYGGMWSSSAELAYFLMENGNPEGGMSLQSYFMHLESLGRSFD